MSWSWDDVKDVVGKAAPLLGSALGPAGGAVGTLIASALGTDDNPEAVASAIQADPDALVKLKALEREHERELRRMVIEAETTRLTEINRTMRAEFSADDAYVRRWRPTYGYATCITWTLQSLAIVAAIIGAAFVYPEHADKILGGLTALMGAMVTMWGIALSVLGINISSRSKDKRVTAGQDGRGLMEKLVDNLGGKRSG
ncbi:hypothetical protein EZI54_03925 [Marinobacter halodurans]|uniref:Holin of 3TMs, for gene-transfer release n=1 Tax=Marinobacter halodurans TaxID=2528979 RepID=A0ABY1ZP81_9GAMM|nr:3TM-type holin [Marinobacter halodurans]TBW58541.1 hypothetical protein EZI54_03925 [Marinobacter halodurans]